MNSYYDNASVEEQEFLDSYDPKAFPVIMTTVDLVLTYTQVVTMRTHITYVLLIRRKNFPFKDKWALPGGFVNSDETTRDAAMRECREEAGVSIKVLPNLLTVADAPDRDPRGRAVSIVYDVSLGWQYKNDDEQPAVYAGDDAIEAKWFDMTAARHIDLAFDHNRILEFWKARGERT